MADYADPRLSAGQAEEVLARPIRPLGRRRRIVKVELLYLPCTLFRVRVESYEKETAEETVCIDSLEGTFAFFRQAEFTAVPCRTGRTVTPDLPPRELSKRALSAYRRHLLALNLHGKRVSQVRNIRLDREIYYPFWIGYFHRRGALDFDVLDAVSGARQGVQMRPVFIKALLRASPE
jgi:hypothetical protein